MREGGRVVAHVPSIILMDVNFVVREAARRRVIVRRQREVLAWADGTPCEARRWPSAARVHFDPYAGPSFVVGDFPVERANLVYFDPDGSCWAIL